MPVTITLGIGLTLLTKNAKLTITVHYRKVISTDMLQYVRILIQSAPNLKVATVMHFMYLWLYVQQKDKIKHHFGISLKKLYTIILKTKGIIIYIPRSFQLSGNELNMPETDPGSVVFCFNCSPATYNLIISLQNDPIK